jgi:hypothetical protein
MEQIQLNMQHLHHQLLGNVLMSQLFGTNNMGLSYSMQNIFHISTPVTVY